jgi:multisubunit Na+/H+ antiporter MnhB subunit
LVFAAGLVSFALRHEALGVYSTPISLAEASWYGMTLCMFSIISAIVVTNSTTRLGTAIAMTINGFFTALLFVLYRSPDILLTQILIETVSTVFLLLILHRMPVFSVEALSPFQRLLNIAISVLVGITMLNLIVLSTSSKFHAVTSLAADYLGHSLGDAGGANAVNVIIVDFRAMDTIGEITVLVMVGLVVFGLLNSRRTAA